MVNKLWNSILAATLVVASFTPGAVQAQSSQPMLDRGLFSIGLGLADNSVGGPAGDETGFQVFAAYNLSGVNLMQGVKSSLEFGYMDYGYRDDSDGIWGTYVANGAINEQFGWLARIGMDIGDDSGLMFGAGLGYRVAQDTDFRVEYVIRDEIDSLQFNLLFRL